MIGRPIVIELPALSRYLVLVRHFIESLAQHMGFPSQEIDKIELALDEACANSIRAIQKSGAGNNTLLRLEFTQHEDALDIVVIDNGVDFSEQLSRSIPVENLVQDYRTSGYGLQIIKTCMDDVRYEYEPEGGNRLCLTKFLS